MPRGNSLSARDEYGQFKDGHDWDTLIPAILARIEKGESLRSICKDEGMPSNPAFIAYVRRYNPDKWEALYDAAMQTRADYYGFKLEELYEDVVAGSLDHNKARVGAQILQVRMGQLAPRRYHDKVIHQTIDHKVSVSVRDRLAKRVEPPTIDAEVFEVGE